MPRYLNYHRKKRSRVEWVSASDIDKCVSKLVKTLKLDWIKTSRIFCFRSFGSTSSARARIWGLPKVWQKALNQKPSYILEVISERYDNLDEFEKKETLLHEIAHIPKNFSGSLVPHYRIGRRKFADKVKSLIYEYQKATQK